MKDDANGKKDMPNIFFPDKFIVTLELYFRCCEEESKYKFQVPLDYVVLESIDQLKGTD
jgi:hypothetical protein